MGARLVTPPEAISTFGSWIYIVIFCSVSFGLGMLFQSRCTRARYSRRVLKLSDEAEQSLSDSARGSRGVSPSHSWRVRRRPEHRAPALRM